MHLCTVTDKLTSCTPLRYILVGRVRLPLICNTKNYVIFGNTVVVYKNRFTLKVSPNIEKQLDNINIIYIFFFFQELATTFYKTLAYYDFDSVWLFLINEYGIAKIREERIVKKDNEHNVEAVLKILNLAKW